MRKREEGGRERGRQRATEIDKIKCEGEGERSKKREKGRRLHAYVLVAKNGEREREGGKEGIELEKIK